MKSLLVLLNVITLSTAVGTLPNILTLNSSLINKDNKHDMITHQDTIYIDENGQEQKTSAQDLYELKSKEIIQIGFFQNENNEIEVVKMPKIVEKVPLTLPPEITSLRLMFAGCLLFNQDITSWDTTNVTDMSYMFASTYQFNQDIGKWNTSNVIDMSSMFLGAISFNQDLSKWNVARVQLYEDFALGSGIDNPNKLPNFQK